MPPRRAYPELQGSGTSKPFPAPLKGLNTRDAYNEMGSDEARVLENILPDLQACVIRPGYAHWCNISGATSVPALATYQGASASKLIGAANGGIYDVTGTSPSTLVASGTYTNNVWQSQCFNGYLFGVNGTDTPWVYNGSSVGSTGFSGTGLTLSNLNTVALVRGGNAGRLWFTQDNSADVWYGPSAGITGTLTKFQLSQIAQGGNCVGIGSWSYDGGSGPQEQTVFIMSTGEVIIYTGDPATTFSIVGTYKAPQPVGLAPTVKLGGELIVMTVNGPIPVSMIFQGVAFNLNELAIWGKIGPSWLADWQVSGSLTGWVGHYFNGLVYFNVPLSANASKQYVLNTRTQAWTNYTNLPVASMADIGGTLYFGSNMDGHVNSHSGTTDNGSSITGIARQGFGYPFGADHSTQFTLMRPNISTNGQASGQFQVDVDFITSPFTAPIVTLGNLTFGASWGAAWGSVWGSTPVTIEQFFGISGYGRAVAPAVQIFSNASQTTWYSSDIVGVPGGIGL